MQPWRSKEEVCDRGEARPANGRLDVLLQGERRGQRNLNELHLNISNYILHRSPVGAV